MKNLIEIFGKRTYSIVRYLLFFLIILLGSLSAAASVAYLFPGSSMLVALVGAASAILIGKFLDHRLLRT